MSYAYALECIALTLSAFPCTTLDASSPSRLDASLVATGGGWTAAAAADTFTQEARVAELR